MFSWFLCTLSPRAKARRKKFQPVSDDILFPVSFLAEKQIDYIAPEKRLPHASYEMKLATRLHMHLHRLFGDLCKVAEDIKVWKETHSGNRTSCVAPGPPKGSKRWYTKIAVLNPPAGIKGEKMTRQELFEDWGSSKRWHTKRDDCPLPPPPQRQRESV